MHTALRRYQVMSWIVGAALLVLTIATILDWAFNEPAMAHVVSPIHGIFYIVYLVTVAQVAARFRPPLRRIVSMVCSGFVPGMAFVVEHRTVKDLRGSLADV
jgi:integral membrane protein